MPFVFQAIAIFVDEFYFHEKRGLPKWERLGHPLDSLTTLLCYSFLFFQVPNISNLKIYIGLCLFSILFITKDEWVHAKESPATEHWLHALLFVIHPLTFLCAGYLWYFRLAPMLITGQMFMVFLFMCYQIIRWNLPWEKWQKTK
ncbi:MAG: hypothetical protein ACOYL6_14580 [Bacteriovoracaceae bacterium]